MTTLNFTRIETGRTTRCLIASLSLQVYVVYSLSLSLSIWLWLSLSLSVYTLPPLFTLSLSLSPSVSACRVRRCAYQAQLTFRWGVVDPQGRHLCATCLSTFGTATVNKAQLQIRGGFIDRTDRQVQRSVIKMFGILLNTYSTGHMFLLCLRKLQTLRIRSVVPLTVRQPASRAGELTSAS